MYSHNNNLKEKDVFFLSLKILIFIRPKFTFLNLKFEKTLLKTIYYKLYKEIRENIRFSIYIHILIGLSVINFKLYQE